MRRLTLILVLRVSHDAAGGQARNISPASDRRVAHWAGVLDVEEQWPHTEARHRFAVAMGQGRGEEGLEEVADD